MAIKHALHLLVLGVLLAFGTAQPAGAETFEGACVGVHDGDTITVEARGKREKIRLLGIDAPEMGQQPWGTISREFARGLVLNKSVRIETDVQQRDKYGRLLGYVYQGRTFVNLALIQNGQAVLLTYPPNVAHVDEFTAAQTAARKAGLGIWSAENPLNQTPYEFRHKQGATPRHPGRGESTMVASPLPGTAVVASPAGTDRVFLNTRSKKYHVPGCGHPSDCKHCVAMTRAEAQAQGGVPCKSGRAQ